MRSTAVECPECGEPYTPQGLHGHLRAHGLRGDDLESTYRQALRDGGSAPVRREVAEESGSVPEEPEDGSETESTEQAGNPDRRPVPGQVSSPSESPAGIEDQEDGKGPSESSGRDRPSRDQHDPIAHAADRLAAARQRREAVEDVMETKTTGGLWKSRQEEVPANETWADLLEECKAEEKAARKELKRQIEHREVDRSV
jgi:hypothetical protein